MTLRDADATSLSSNMDRVLVDPDDFDDSEEQFEDSLTSSAQPEQYRSIPLGHQYQNARDPEPRKTETDSDSSAGANEPGYRSANSHTEQSPDWREAISNKLDLYRDKRGRKQLSGNYTMRLDFERTARRAAFASAAAVAALPQADVSPEPDEMVTESLEQSAEVEEHPYAEAVSPAPTGLRADETCIQQEEAPAPAPKPKRERRIIEFPRLFVAESQSASANELAESVIDRPRILDVPEETEQIELPLGGISFDAASETEEPAARSEFEVPIQVAAVSQRFFAALVDWMMVLTATAVFAGIVLNMAKDLPHNKIVLAFGLATPVVFWATYHYLFLVHAAATPGMKMAQLRLAAFSGKMTDRHIRRSRALAMMVSCASAGLGFGWAVVDEDTLCWHDRISRTYLTNRT